MESKRGSVECKDVATGDSSSPAMSLLETQYDVQRDLVNYFSRLNAPSDLAEVYVRTLQALNIPGEKSLKEELVVRLLIGIGRG